MLTVAVCLGGAFGAAVALAVVLHAAWLGRILRVVDQPDGWRKTHARPTPLVGGLAVVLPALVVLLLSAACAGTVPLFLVLAAATSLAVLLGLLDDRRHLSPSLRLALSTLVCAGALWFLPDLQVSFFRFSFLREALFLDTGAALFTVVCLIGLQNAVNMADGRNGLVIGQALAWTALLALYAPSSLLPLLATLGGALAVTFVANLRERLFLGDSGTYGLAMLYGLLAVFCHSVDFARLPSDAVALMFLLPVLDCVRVMFARLARGRSPFTPDRGHLHHILSDLLPWRYGLPIYLAMVALPSFAAALAPQLTLPMALAVLSCYTLLLTVGGRQLARQRASAA